MSEQKILPPKPTRHLARLTFTSFLLTFIASRTLVILIMTRRMPDLFLHMGGTHVHHLNYGIFILSAVAGVLLFGRLNDKQRSVCALAYGFGMALTFDEFGMWLHLGGSYWQRASFDAVIVLLGVFGILAVLPQWQRIRAHHYLVGRSAAGIGRAFLFVAGQVAQTCERQTDAALDGVGAKGTA